MGTHECDTCNRNFNTWKACQQHMTAVDHWIWSYECETCTTRFNTVYSRDQHMEEKNHFAFNYPCQTCNVRYRFEVHRDEHQSDEGHYKHLHCADCDRYFQSPNNLSQHMKSRVHQGTSISCPFCNAAFVTASGVSHHLESSACPRARNLDRNAIHRALRQRDPRGVITERLIEYHDDDSDSDSDDEASWSPASAWNGSFYECYMCHREFGSPRALEQHLSSPAHQAPLYHCPNKTGSCGGKRFPTLAALFNHLESESCSYVKFSAVQTNVSGFLTGAGQRLIAF